MVCKYMLSKVASHISKIVEVFLKNINRLWKVVDYTSKTVEIFLRKTNRLSDRSYIKEGGDVLIQSWKLLDQTFFKEKQPVINAK